MYVFLYHYLSPIEAEKPIGQSYGIYIYEKVRR